MSEKPGMAEFLPPRSEGVAQEGLELLTRAAHRTCELCASIRSGLNAAREHADLTAEIEHDIAAALQHLGLTNNTANSVEDKITLLKNHASGISQREATKNATEREDALQKLTTVNSLLESLNNRMKDSLPRPFTLAAASPEQLQEIQTDAANKE